MLSIHSPGYAQVCHAQLDYTALGEVSEIRDQMTRRALCLWVATCGLIGSACHQEEANQEAWVTPDAEVTMVVEDSGDAAPEITTTLDALPDEISPGEVSPDDGARTVDTSTDLALGDGDAHSAKDTAASDALTGDGLTQDADAPQDAPPDGALLDTPGDDSSDDAPTTTEDVATQDVSADAQDALDTWAGEVAQDGQATFECSDTGQLALYAQRIEPLVSGNAVSSCNQCHLAGVDLSMYVQGSPCETMACMIAEGLVDLEAPDQSGVLAQILQAEPQSALITEEVINEEYEGFLEWILYSADCHDEVCGEVQDACAGGPAETANVPDGVATPLGACSEAGLIDLFDERVYAWKGRCHGCHDDCENEKWEAPCWLVYPDQGASPGELLEAASMSMYNLIGIGAFDPYDPANSQALLKPMAMSMGGVEHGGGDKFYDFADLAYQDFMVFALQYGACYQGLEPWWPTVSITQPKNKTKYYEGDVAPVLEGAATDPQEGSIADDAAYVWTRHVVDGEDELLAVGQGPHQISLALGKHIVTLTVMDSDGNSSSRSVKVWMKTAP